VVFCPRKIVAGRKRHRVEILDIWPVGTDNCFAGAVPARQPGDTCKRPASFERTRHIAQRVFVFAAGYRVNEKVFGKNLAMEHAGVRTDQHYRHIVLLVHPADGLDIHGERRCADLDDYQVGRKARYPTEQIGNVQIECSTIDCGNFVTILFENCQRVGLVDREMVAGCAGSGQLVPRDSERPPDVRTEPYPVGILPWRIDKQNLHVSSSTPL